jgi:5-formyltetrahydrofolate cyclo-ligase
LDLRARKAALRREMDARRRALGPGEAGEAAEALARRLAATPEFAAARRIALYAASGGELATGPLLREARARDRVVLWPRVRGGALEFAACDAEALAPGAFGVPAPPASLEAVRLDAADLVVLPALALDGAGRRLGRGGGHYDRAFAGAAAERPLRVGVGYDFQLVDEVPAGEGDARVDLVVSERRLLRVRAAAGAR